MYIYMYIVWPKVILYMYLQILIKYRFGFINWSVLPHAWGKSDQMTGIFVTDVTQATKPCTRFVSACLPL